MVHLVDLQHLAVDDGDDIVFFYSIVHRAVGDLITAAVFAPCHLPAGREILQVWLVEHGVGTF